MKKQLTNSLLLRLFAFLLIGGLLYACSDNEDEVADLPNVMNMVVRTIPNNEASLEAYADAREDFFDQVALQDGLLNAVEFGATDLGTDVVYRIDLFTWDSEAQQDQALQFMNQQSFQSDFDVIANISVLADAKCEYSNDIFSEDDFTLEGWHEFLIRRNVTSEYQAAKDAFYDKWAPATKVTRDFEFTLLEDHLNQDVDAPAIVMYESAEEWLYTLAPAFDSNSDNMALKTAYLDSFEGLILFAVSIEDVETPIVE